MTENERFSAIWNRLTPLQRQFVVARTVYPNKRQAALSLGIRPNTAYKWGSLVDEAHALYLADTLSALRDGLQQLGALALLAKGEALQDPDPRIRQQVATEVLDRIIGKALPATIREDPASDNHVVVTYVNRQK
jgi:hypothetical protein